MDKVPKAKFAWAEQTENLDLPLAALKRTVCKRQGIDLLQFEWTTGRMYVSSEDSIVGGSETSARRTWSQGRDLLARAFLDLGSEADFLILSDDDVFIVRNSRLWRSLLSQRPWRRAQGSLLVRKVDPRRLIRAAATWALRGGLSLRRQRRILEGAFRQLDLEIAETSELATGAIRSLSDWGFEPGEQLCLHDLQTQIFSRQAASHLLPAPISGSGGSGWYVQFLALHFWPDRHIRLNSVLAVNLETRPHQDEESGEFCSLSELIRETDKALPTFSAFFSAAAGDRDLKVSSMVRARKLREQGVDPVTRDFLLTTMDDRFRVAAELLKSPE